VTATILNIVIGQVGGQWLVTGSGIINTSSHNAILGSPERAFPSLLPTRLYPDATTITFDLYKLHLRACLCAAAPTVDAAIPTPT